MLPRGNQTLNPLKTQRRDSRPRLSGERSSPCEFPEPEPAGVVQRTSRRCIILPMLGNRTNERWIAQYSSSHQNRVNRICHTLGIPFIVFSILLFLVSIFIHRLWTYALALFLLGWILQFIGHAFEGKPPEFLSDWRFLFVGVRWWWAKIQGKA
jgi:hypothetical protein